MLSADHHGRALCACMPLAYSSEASLCTMIGGEEADEGHTTQHHPFSLYVLMPLDQTLQFVHLIVMTIRTIKETGLGYAKAIESAPRR